MKQTVKSLCFLFALVLITSGCNKEKRYSKRLIKGETWNLEAVTVDGANTGITGGWKVTGDDIYKEVPRIEWISGSTEPTIIEWQFQDKGETYQFNYLQQCNDADGTQMEKTDFQASDLTGTYQVETHKRKEMVFTSTTTKGYNGKKVEIRISRN